MSANLDLVRSIYAAIERGDFASSEWADPDIERVVVDGPEPGTFRGLAGLAEGMRTVFRDMEDVRAEAEECRELDGERVLVLVHYAGRGRESGVDLGLMRTEGANLFHVRGGKVTRLVIYMDRDNALADLGLEA